MSLIAFTSYGYVTNTKVKFVIVVDSSNTSLRDNEIRSVSWSQILSYYSHSCLELRHPGHV